MSKLIKGDKISKSDPIFELLGSIDELNAFIGLAISIIEDEQIKKDLRDIQVAFSKMMSDISGSSEDSGDTKNISNFLEWLEARIETMGEKITIAKEFSFPGKTEVGAGLDICRTIARRVERIAAKIDKKTNPHVEKYYPILNRISSYFFVLRKKMENS